LYIHRNYFATPPNKRLKLTGHSSLHVSVLPFGHDTKRFQLPGHLGRQLSREPLGGGSCAVVTLEEARSLVEAAIADGDPPRDDIPVVLDKETIERPWGWIFFYQSRHFVETGDFSSFLVGNAPLIVERSSGRLIPTGTAHPVEFYLRNYEATGDPHLQLGREIELSASTSNADRIAAAKLLSRTCSLSIGDAKRAVDSILHGTAFYPRASTPDKAREVCAALQELGFTARQLPEPAA
jgi:hypothetical protein